MSTIENNPSNNHGNDSNGNGNNSNANDNHMRIHHHDRLVALRDMAAPLVGDPQHADAIAREALQNLRARKAKLEGAEATWWLEQEVLSLALAATDCLRCAEQEDPDWAPPDTERELDDGEPGEDDDDEDDDDLEDTVESVA
jgi:hypothetical protein